MTCFSSLDNFQNISNITCSWSNDYEDLKVHLTLTRFSVQRIVIPMVVIFGIFGNLMSIAVLTRRWMRSSTNYYLTALAIYDTLYLIFAATMSFNDYKRISNVEWYLRYKAPIGKPLADIFSNTAVWLTLTFTIERWLCVCHPMRGRLWCTPNRAKYIIIIVCLLAALVTFPEFFESRFQSTTGEVHQTDFANTTIYKFGYVYSNQILFTFVPLLLLLIFNTLLIKAVYRAAKRRNSMVQCHSRGRKNTNSTSSSVSIKQERNQTDQQKVTITLISVVVVFLLCQGPQAIVNMYYRYLQYTQGLSKKKLYSLGITGNILNLLVMINASVNFVLYSTFNTKFRRTVKRISKRTYNRMQRQSRRSKETCHTDSIFPYHGKTTPSPSTIFTKISPACTEDNIHCHLVAKHELNKNGCNTWNIPLKAMSLQKDHKDTLLAIGPNQVEKKMYLTVEPNVVNNSVDYV